MLGLFNKESRRILAREVNDIAAPQKIAFGVISNIDKENYEVTITKANGAKYIFEIQDITKSFSFSLDTLTKSGFSKMQIGQAIIAMGFTDKKNSGKILTSRIIILPEINLSTTISVVNESTTPSTGSGIKLYPITK